MIADKAQCSINTAAHVYSMSDIALAIDALCAEARESGYSHGWGDRAALSVNREVALTAQRDRLREALTRISNMAPQVRLKTCIQIARAALKEVEG